MTQTTFTDNVLVDGSQDIKQLRVQGHTTQTQQLQTWEDSAGNTVAQVTGDGRLIVGDDVTPDSLIEAHRLDTSTSKPTRGLHSLGQVTGTLSALVQWIVGELELTGASAISALHTALRVRASNKSTVAGSAGAEVRGADIEVINDALSNAAAFPKATGMQVTLTNAAGKTITDAIGLKVKMNNAGTITNPFAIYTEGPGPIHLEDYVEVKRPAATPGTPATDFVRMYPKIDGKLYAKDWNGVEYDLTAVGSGGGVSIASVCDGRLTLTDSVPVPVLDVTAATMLYFTPFKGSQIALFNGSSWVMYSFSQIALNLGSLSANTLYDIFIYDNAGVLTLEAVPWTAPASGSITSISNATPRVVTVPSHSLVTGQKITISGNSVASNNGNWRVGTIITATTFQLFNLDGNNSTLPGSVGTGGTWQRADQNASRTVALIPQNGVYLKSGATGRRYLGTIRTTHVAGQCADSVKQRFVFNENNPVSRKIKAVATAGQWPPSGATWRAANNSIDYRVEVVIGNVGTLASLDVLARATASGAGITTGVGYDSVTATINDVYTSLSNDGHISAQALHQPDTIGYHFYQWLENNRSVAGATIFGVAADGFVSGMVGDILL